MSSDHWRLEEIALDELDAYLEQVAGHHDEKFDVVDNRFYGDDKSWHCPYCVDLQHCSRVGTVPLDDDGSPGHHNELVATTKRTWGWLTFLADPLGALVARVSDELLADQEVLEARVYECKVHGQFYIRRVGDHDDAFMPWQVREDVMVKSPPLFLPCMGLIRDQSSAGETLRVRVCWNLMKWWGTNGKPGDGDGGYACVVHGEQRQLLEPGFEGPFVLATRVVG